MEAVVEASELRKSYGETVALAGVSVAIERGEIFGLIGPNGAGKTTLVRALTGTTEPDSGTARVLGDPPPATDRNRLAVLPQAFSPPDRLTAHELLSYYAGCTTTLAIPRRYSQTWPRRRRRHVVRGPSGGQQRRVCVGRRSSTILTSSFWTSRRPVSTPRVGGRSGV
ncbi:ATP-binding cassette domain-containing protein [Natrialba swarupiae]|nr:ATP-binding cassette domain-containing protein [Natrialba swarupiae]